MSLRRPTSMAYFCCTAVAASARVVRLSDETPFFVKTDGLRLGWDNHGGVAAAAFEFIPERSQRAVGADTAPPPAPTFIVPRRTQPPPIH